MKSPPTIPCSSCHGSGHVEAYRRDPQFAHVVECEDCEGRGWVESEDADDVAACAADHARDEAIDRGLEERATVRRAS